MSQGLGILYTSTAGFYSNVVEVSTCRSSNPALILAKTGCNFLTI